MGWERMLAAAGAVMVLATASGAAAQPRSRQGAERAHKAHRAPASAPATPFRFLVTGDLPYSAGQAPGFRALLKRSEAEDFEFLVHVGDFRGQSEFCPDPDYLATRDLLAAYPKPVVYTPGDNEWTDCRAPQSDPLERLARLRTLFYGDARVLRLGKLNAHCQHHDPGYAEFQENYRFRRGGVLFVVLHVVGSSNNRRPGDPAAMAEFKRRNAANLAFLEQSLALAKMEKKRQPAEGVVIIFHANPTFETGGAPGYRPFVAALRDYVQQTARPVLAIHGDTHTFRIDKPLKAQSGHTLLNFTRLEVFGSPDIGAVEVRVDPGDPQLFQFRPYVPKTASH